jgi:hypothetical protein
MSLGELDASRANAEIGASFCLDLSVKPEFAELRANFCYKQRAKRLSEAIADKSGYSGANTPRKMGVVA